MVIGLDRKSPVAVSVLSFGLLLPFGAGAIPDRAIAMIADVAGQIPTKHVTFISGHVRDSVETRTVTVDGFLRERGITRQPDDSLSTGPDAPIVDGSTIVYRPAVHVDLIVDGVSRPIRSAAATVADALAAEHLSVAAHDTVTPSLRSAVEPDSSIRISRSTSWLERIRTAILPPVQRKFDIGMLPGTERVVDPGRAGSTESTVEVLQPNPAVAPKRSILAARILRFPRARVIAQGVGDYSALAGLARRGVAGTMRLADAALKMIATAYTASCSGCSGFTASGRPAGHGVVAVDPRYIPLGSHLYIPGYGHALAGDTGGSIRGNRIDLGFDTHRDAMSFGRRPIVVYVLK